MAQPNIQNSILRQMNAFANQYYPLNLLENAFARTLYFYKHAKKVMWTGEKIIVPFTTNRSNSLMMGGFTESANITHLQGFRGEVPGSIAITGSVKFHDRDLLERGQLRVQTFVPTLKRELDAIVDRLTGMISLQFGSGPWFASATAVGNATGTIPVDRIYAFDINQRIIAGSQSGTSSPIAPIRLKVTAINIQNKSITVAQTSDNMPPNLTTWTPAKKIRFFVDIPDTTLTIAKVENSNFCSVRQALVEPGAAGGATHIYNLPKSQHHVLRALNFNGSATQVYDGTTSNRNLLQQIFVTNKEIEARGVKAAKNVIMSLEKFAVCKHILEQEKRQYNLQKGTTVGDKFAWPTIRVHTVANDVLTIVGVREWENDLIAFIDWTTWRFYTNGGIRQVASLGDGNMFYWERDKTGHSYIADFQCYGQLVCHYPVGNAILHSIPSGTAIGSIDLKLTA